MNGLVDSWISLEEQIADGIKSVRVDKEPLMPGAAFLAGSFVAGIAVARGREFERLGTALRKAN
jgi:hypothetical protein